MTIGTRHDFGKDWNEVVKNWCLGVPLPVPSEKAWEALEVLETFWPEYLGKVLTDNNRGSLTMAYVIENGLTLAACQNLRGFPGVLSRIKDGNQDALPEARFAAVLVSFGHQPVLDEEYKGYKPDLLILSEEQEVFIDVITPHMSDDAKRTETLATTLYGGPKSQDHLRVKIRQTPAIQEMTRYLLVYTCAGV